MALDADPEVLHYLPGGTPTPRARMVEVILPWDLAGYARPGTTRVYAETMAVNRASRRVMERIGLRHVRTFHVDVDDPIPGTEQGEVEDALTRAEWSASGGEEVGEGLGVHDDQ